MSDQRGNERAAAHLATAHYNQFKRGDINYVVATMSEREYEEFEQDDSPDEDAKEYETSTPDASWSYGAERTLRANRDAWREVLDGVYMPHNEKEMLVGGETR